MARVTGERFAQMRNSLNETTTGRRQLANYLQHGWGVNTGLSRPMQAYFSGGRKLFVRYVVTDIFDFISEKD